MPFSVAGQTVDWTVCCRRWNVAECSVVAHIFLPRLDSSEASNMSEEPEISLSRAALQTLESLQAAGVQQLAKPTAEAIAVAAEVAETPPVDPPTNVDGEPPAKQPPAKQEADEAIVEPTTQPVSAAPTLEVLAEEVAACTLCEELASTRKQTVFGVGNPNARLCILGEAPGADEDRLGEPFVGRGGQLLNKIIEACKLKRSDVYILNVLRCRPPGNRNPTEEEAHNCRRFLDRQLQLVDPEFICCMGAVAAQNLLTTTTTIGRLRGSLHDYQGRKVVCTYHPAYLLRNPSAKKYTWDDMKMLMRAMGTPVD